MPYTPQYRDDNDRPLYDTSSGNPMRECCCDSCNDSVACHRFDACCDLTLYAERIDHPHYIVIADTEYTSLGDPACVVHNGCCYCDHDSSTTKGATVTGVSTDTSFTSCDSCNNVHEDSCETCNECNGCQLPRTYKVSFSGSPDSSSFTGYMDIWNPYSLNALSLYNCEWYVRVAGQYQAALSNVTGAWGVRFQFEPISSANCIWISDTASYDSCDPSGVYHLTTVGAGVDTQDSNSIAVVS